MKHHKEYPVHFSHGEPRKISIPLDEYKHLKEIEKLYTELKTNGTSTDKD